MKRYVLDTTALISYFQSVFEQPPKLSAQALSILDRGFSGRSILIIPSIVFIELFKKWYRSEEIASKIRYEVYERVRNVPTIEIKPLEAEVLENFVRLSAIESPHNFDNHDKQILSSAMMLNCPLITSDNRIIKFNRNHKVIPAVIS